MHDIVIRHGEVVDGTGAPPVRADVAIDGDRITDVGVVGDGLRLLTPELVTDFPLGASRFVQRAEGYDYTLVNGKVFVDHGELTDERPGRLVTAGERNDA